MRAAVEGHYFDSNEATEIAGKFYWRKYDAAQTNQIIYYMPNEGVFFNHIQYYEYIPPHFTNAKIEEWVELITEEQVINYLTETLFNFDGVDTYGCWLIINRKLRDAINGIDALIETFDKTFDNFKIGFPSVEYRALVIISIMEQYLERIYSQDWILSKKAISRYIEIYSNHFSELKKFENELEE